MGECAKMILNFALRVFLILKFCEVQKEYPTLGSSANIVFSFKRNKIYILKNSYAPHYNIIFYFNLPPFTHNDFRPLIHPLVMVGQTWSDGSGQGAVAPAKVKGGRMKKRII